MGTESRPQDTTLKRWLLSAIWQAVFLTQKEGHLVSMSDVASALRVVADKIESSADNHMVCVKEKKDYKSG